MIRTNISKRVLLGVVFVLVTIQAVLIVVSIRRESLTFDEADHIYAGYQMWTKGDYGLNPEHPPLVKLLAAIPLLGRHLWTPPDLGYFFKEEAYTDGRDFLARNDCGRNRLVFDARLAASLLAITLSVVVFLTAREFFGDWAAITALTLCVFDPNILAHSGLVTTDIGVALFFLLSVYCFSLYLKNQTLATLIGSGVAVGLLLATKHSGILIAPMLILLSLWEIWRTEPSQRTQKILRLAGSFTFIMATAVLVLWAFYLFRFASRPAGLTIHPSLVEYAAPFGKALTGLAACFGRLHILPEAYVFGMIDVARSAATYSTFIFGLNFPHGVWWYFPCVIAIKSTLGLLSLSFLSLLALISRKMKWSHDVWFVIIPAGLYLFASICSGMNIGVRHLLPFYAFLFVFAGAGAAALGENKRWLAWCVVVLVALHVISSLAVFPSSMVYANEAWGGAQNVHNLLSDSNVDWGQQLYQVKAWQDSHPAEECWFAYFAYTEIDPATYGIHCHHLPTLQTYLGGADLLPPTVQGTVLLSAGTLSGCEWPDSRLNPYRAFQHIKPAESIEHSVFVYRGQFNMSEAAALSRAERSYFSIQSGDKFAGIQFARDAVEVGPSLLVAHLALGDALEASGLHESARQEWETSKTELRQLDDGAQMMFGPHLKLALDGRQ